MRTPRKTTIRTNDRKIQEYTRQIQLCLEILVKEKQASAKRAKEMAEILAAAIVGISLRAISNDDLLIKLQDEIIVDSIEKTFADFKQPNGK